MRAPSFRGRFCGYKHVRRAAQTVKECCMQAARQPALHIPKTSAGRFLADVPITDRPRQPLGSCEGWFPIFRCRMSGIANGIVAAAGEHAPLSPGRSKPYSGPFWAAGPSQSENSGREPGSLATHRAGRAYYIYVASHDAKQGILVGNPKGSFGRPMTVTSRCVWPRQEQATEKWGRSRHSG